MLKMFEICQYYWNLKSVQIKQYIRTITMRSSVTTSYSKSASAILLFFSTFSGHWKTFGKHKSIKHTLPESKNFHPVKSNRPCPPQQKNIDPILVGGFNPFEKYWSNWITPPGRGENEKSLNPPSSYSSFRSAFIFQQIWPNAPGSLFLLFKATDQSWDQSGRCRWLQNHDTFPSVKL